MIVSKLKIRDRSGGSRDSLRWSWVAGDSFDLDALGTPTITSSYHTCVYDSDADGSFGAISLSLLPGPLWRDRGDRGFTYRDRKATVDGIRKLDLKPGSAGKAKTAC